MGSFSLQLQRSIESHTPMPASLSHLVLIPSYNPGATVYETVKAARKYWSPVWVVVDGSTDGTVAGLQEMALADPDLKIIVLEKNQGKGAAVLHGIDMAFRQGYTHVLTMDSDGQHDASMIPVFMEQSQNKPDAMILGVPIFDASAPSVRVKGRKISNWWANFETCGGGIGDSLFGFRVYPIEPLRAIMQKQHWMRRFDFDPEAVVRLRWRGVKPVNIPAKVRYLNAEEGGVSHFNYWRDNKLLTWMYTRLFFGFLLRLPILLWRKARSK
ncbi:glycosyltransferase family 2 protein [Oxalobacteraceae bacterium R-40]|uniref:Glycosyltransferase family 2 protein n=1 Tax=Keguizhuia sedimenti TaxID=3064264 RepID=A0ABU1BUX2_9BURK|nr:glycosyltransferase family 2 protein [Oxalobacteraceae bacterium R-40]